MLSKVERWIAVVTALIAAAAIGLSCVRPARVDWLAYGGMFALGASLVAIGLMLRRRGQHEAWSLPLVSLGLYSAYGGGIALLNYLLLPVGNRLVDARLIKSDALLGFSWPDYIAAFASAPWLGKALGYIYVSSLAQLLAVIIILGALRKRAALELFILTGVIACTLTVAVWYVVPSTGPSAHFQIPSSLAETIGLVVDPAYGARVKALALHGPQLISPKTDLGLVAFPSFHTVMALLAVWFLAGIKRAFVPALLLNAAMVPAILLHGGHYLTDVFGGAFVFAASLFAARRLIADPAAKGCCIPQNALPYMKSGA